MTPPDRSPQPLSAPQVDEAGDVLWQPDARAAELARIDAEIKQQIAMYEDRLAALRADSPEARLARYEQARREGQQRQRDDEAIRQRMELESLIRERNDQLREFFKASGERYAKCRLGNYQITHPGQRQAVDTLRSYCEHIADRITEGVGLLLVGPCGTGKDHLLSAVARVAITVMARHDKPTIVEWTSGPELFGSVRDGFGKDADGDSEGRIIKRFSHASVCYISDPIPPCGRLTDFQSNVLYRLIDRRYSHGRPLWLSVNATSRDDMENALGPAMPDRMLDGAIVVICDWPSYRRPARPEGMTQ